jgi:DnaJ-class molecular chaperone
MKRPEPDYYRILGLSQQATMSQVRKAYHRLAMIHHPDKKAPGQSIDAVEFRKVWQ